MKKKKSEILCIAGYLLAVLCMARPSHVQAVSRNSTVENINIETSSTDTTIDMAIEESSVSNTEEPSSNNDIKDDNTVNENSPTENETTENTVTNIVDPAISETSTEEITTVITPSEDLTDDMSTTNSLENHDTAELSDETEIVEETELTEEIIDENKLTVQNMPSYTIQIPSSYTLDENGIGEINVTATSVTNIEDKEIIVSLKTPQQKLQFSAQDEEGTQYTIPYTVINEYGDSYLNCTNDDFQLVHFTEDGEKSFRVEILSNHDIQYGMDYTANLQYRIGWRYLQEQ